MAGLLQRGVLCRVATTARRGSALMGPPSSGAHVDDVYSTDPCGRIGSPANRGRQHIGGHVKKILAALPTRFRWTLHNVVGHPAAEVLKQVGLVRAADWIHDGTAPEAPSAPEDDGGRYR